MFWCNTTIIKCHYLRQHFISPKCIIKWYSLNTNAFWCINYKITPWLFTKLHLSLHLAKVGLTLFQFQLTSWRVKLTKKSFEEHASMGERCFTECGHFTKSNGCWGSDGSYTDPSGDALKVCRYRIDMKAWCTYNDFRVAITLLIGYVFFYYHSHA